ncbi:MAG: hypothetical protein D6696_03450 [Acidobacteria bacterium]|nr:MAG: hypothetical protein D6696_03450 [Acidobacteriota bacterium]
MTNDDDVTAEIGRWLRRRDLTVQRLRPLPGDVSPRRYLRLRLADGRRAVAAVYPPAIRDAGRRFLATTRLLEGAGVRVPAVYDHDLDAGFMLVEDLGEHTLYDLDLDWARRSPYLDDAVAQIARIQTIPAAPVEALNPPLDGALLRRELEQTWHAVLLPRGAAANAELAGLPSALAELCANLAADPPVVCHRDLMARNLVPLEEPRVRVGLLDHQDLRLGPPYYDLASLLNDSLFAPEDVERRLLAALAPTAAQQLAYRRAAAQRTLKAAGTFARCLEAGATHHRRLIAPTLARALHHLRQVPETAALAPALARQLEPELGALGIC